MMRHLNATWPTKDAKPRKRAHITCERSSLRSYCYIWQVRISVNFNANESFPSLELWAPLPPPSKPFFSLHLVSSFCRQWPSLRPQHSLSLLGPRGLPHRPSSRQSSQLCSSPLEGMPPPSFKILIGKTKYSKKACVEISCL